MIFTKNAVRISYAGVMSALSFVLLYLGSVLWIFAYTAPLFCGIIIMSVNGTFGRKYAVTVYITVGKLGLLFAPDKEAVLVYIFFFGYYPMIKEQLEKIKPKALSFFIKLLIFNTGIAASQLLLIYAFGIPFENEFGKLGIPLFIALFNLLFVTYEFMYKAVLNVYKDRIEKRIKNLLNI